MHIINIIGKKLDYLKSKNEAVSHNIANLNTPAFKRKDVEFSGMLKDSETLLTKKTHPAHIGSAANSRAFRVFTDTAPAARQDGNNVFIEKEIMELHKTQIEHQALIKMLNSRLRAIKIVITTR